MKRQLCNGKKLIFLLTIIALSFLSQIATAQDAQYPRIRAGMPMEEVLKVLLSKEVFEPTKLFDNLAYIGYMGVGSFVIKTSDGLILIDTMWKYTDGRDVVEPGIKKLGWNPEDIKYVLISHEHGDHYGSAKYYEDNYGAKVFITKIGWDNMHKPSPRPIKDPWGNLSDTIPLFTKFNEMKDQQKITLGDTTITVLTTPGHSQGCVSFIIPVTDNGTPHKMALWGGTGLRRTIEENETYLKSLNYFESVANAAGVDAEASIHPFVNDLLNKMAALQIRKPGEPNPVVIGNQGFRHYIDSDLRKGVTTLLAKMKEKK